METCFPILVYNTSLVRSLVVVFLFHFLMHFFLPGCCFFSVGVCCPPNLGESGSALNKALVLETVDEYFEKSKLIGADVESDYASVGGVGC
jgi:hypothetical protein